MQRPPGTRWFSLYRRELVVLLVTAAAALAAAGAIRGVDFIWGRGEVTVAQSGDTLVAPARLNVNTAEVYELTALPRIGPKTARAIVDYRREHGPFASLEDLVKVRGIGPKTLEAVRPHAMCAPVPEPAEETED